MTFGIEDKRGVEVIEWMFRIEKKEQILRSFAEEKAFHAVALLSGADILQASPSALGPTSTFDVSQNHLSDVEIPWVLGGPIQIPSGLDELWTTSPPP